MPFAHSLEVFLSLSSQDALLLLIIGIVSSDRAPKGWLVFSIVVAMVAL
jgi:hypothetical protein